MWLPRQKEGYKRGVKMICQGTKFFKIQKTSFKRPHSSVCIIERVQVMWRSPKFHYLGFTLIHESNSITAWSLLFGERTLNSGSQATSCSPRAWPSVRHTAGAQLTPAGPAPPLLPSFPGVQSPFLRSRPLLHHPDPARCPLSRLQSPPPAANATSRPTWSPQTSASP